MFIIKLFPIIKSDNIIMGIEKGYEEFQTNQEEKIKQG